MRQLLFLKYNNMDIYTIRNSTCIFTLQYLLVYFTICINLLENLKI